MTTNTEIQPEIWAEARGEGIPTLLIAGTGDSATIWPPALIDELVARGRRVITFDHRDAGWSSLTPEDSAYTLDDMADDAARVLARHSATAATIVGYSLGGAIGQILAVRYPELVHHLVLVATPARPDAGYEQGPAVTEMWSLDMNDADAVQAWLQRAMAADGATADELQRVLEAKPAAVSIRAILRHATAALTTTPPTEEQLAALTMSCDIIHGDRDLSVPLANARAVARDIPGARLHVVAGAGHTMTGPVCAAICEVLSGVRAS